MQGNVGFDVIFEDNMGKLNSTLESVYCDFPVWDPEMVIEQPAE